MDFLFEWCTIRLETHFTHYLLCYSLALWYIIGPFLSYIYGIIQGHMKLLWFDGLIDVFLHTIENNGAWNFCWCVTIFVVVFVYIVQRSSKWWFIWRCLGYNLNPNHLLCYCDGQFYWDIIVRVMNSYCLITIDWVVWIYGVRWSSRFWKLCSFKPFPNSMIWFVINVKLICWSYER